MKIAISKSYGENSVFQDLSLEIENGTITCVLGESGGGKTTLLNILAGLIPYEGNVTDVPKTIGYIFQEPRLLPNLTVEENLRYVGGMYESIEDILQKTELFALRNKRPKELSGGEKQRVAIARAFLSVDKEGLLLLDEPFSSLDTALKIRLSRVFARLWQEKQPTVVFVTHDIEEACMLGQRIVVLKDGKIAFNERLLGVELPRGYGEAYEIKKRLLDVLLQE